MPADRRLHSLVDLLDQTGQGVAHIACEDESDQVIPASDRAQALAGAGAGHPLREEARAVIGRPDRGTGTQPAVGWRSSCQHQEGTHSAGE
jgi:hypothetical protein